MAASPMPDPSQQQQPSPQQGMGGGADPSAGGASPSQAPAPPELMWLASKQQELKQFAQAVPTASAGLAKAIAGINEAMSAFVSQPQQQAPSQSPPY